MLQKMRLQRGLSQSQLAGIAGISVRTLQAYEQNAKNIDGAKLDTLIDLSNALGCRIRDILTSEELKEKCDKAEL